MMVSKVCVTKKCIIILLVEKMPDAVLPRLGAKVTYFSLAVVRQLEKMGVLIINEFAALETSKDKLSTMQQCKHLHTSCFNIN